MQLYKHNLFFNAIENYINWRYKFRMAFFGAFLYLFLIKYCSFQQGGLGERCKLPQWGPGQKHF